MFKSAYVLVILAVMAVAILAAPYQELIPKKGHIAVYIREGNTPLSEIHPKLSEAFKEENPAEIQNKTPEIAGSSLDSKIFSNLPTNKESDIAEFDDVESKHSDEHN